MKNRVPTILASILFAFVIVWVAIRGNEDDRKAITDILETQWAVEYQAYRNLDSSLLSEIYTNAPEICPLSESTLTFIKQSHGVKDFHPEGAGLLSLQEAYMAEYALARRLESQNNQLAEEPTQAEAQGLADETHLNGNFYLPHPYPMPEGEARPVSYPMPEKILPPLTFPGAYATTEAIQPSWTKASIRFIGVVGVQAVAYVGSSMGTRLITLVRQDQGWRIGCEKWLTYYP